MTDAPEFRTRFFHVRDESGVAVLDVTRSQLTEEENLEELEHEFGTLIEMSQFKQIVLDLKAVRYMTSSAIGKLISLHRRLARSGGQLVLCSLQPDVASVFETSHLTDYFQISPSSTAAISQLS